MGIMKASHFDSDIAVKGKDDFMNGNNMIYYGKIRAGAMDTQIKHSKLLWKFWFQHMDIMTMCQMDIVPIIWSCFAVQMSLGGTRVWKNNMWLLMFHVSN